MIMKKIREKQNKADDVAEFNEDDVQLEITQLGYGTQHSSPANNQIDSKQEKIKIGKLDSHQKYNKDMQDAFQDYVNDKNSPTLKVPELHKFRSSKTSL